jgi:hypothetical protein
MGIKREGGRREGREGGERADTCTNLNLNYTYSVYKFITAA